MASENANDYDYRLIKNETGLKDAISDSELKGKIAERNTLLAVDCEGVLLSRKRALTIITVATEEKVYIFDVLKLGQLVFSCGLGEILEDKSREKLTFDCRQDSDALWHQFNVKLSRVLDLQLIEVIYRRENPIAGSTVNTPKFSTNKRGGRRNRRSQRPDEIEKIYGFGRCIELYVQDEKLSKIKEKGKELLKDDEKVWTKRPLTDDLIQYCIVDTMAMFRLYNKLKDVSGGEHDIARLRVASEKYVDLYRGKTERSFDEYETNAYLPLDIIPDKGTLDFPAANTECTYCDRRFPREEFSKTQLRNGEQKCRVCKEIKREEDVAQNRADNWERAAWEAREAEMNYFPEGMSDHAFHHGYEPWEKPDDYIYW